MQVSFIYYLIESILMNFRKLFSFFIAAILLFAVSCANAPKNKNDDFAKCLAEKGVKMYGAYWCPHCSNQKSMFGDSWQYVAYVECSLPNRAGQTKDCADAGIQSYPTWDFGNGKRTTGEFTFEMLAEASGCKMA